MIVRFSHFGHAVRSLPEIREVYVRLWGLHPTIRLPFPEEGVRNAMLPIGQNFIELLEPTGPESLLSKALAQRGEGMYHLSVVVDDVDGEIRRLRSLGAKVAEAPPQTNLPTKRGWVHPRSTKGVLIELVDEPLMAYLNSRAQPVSSAHSHIIKLSHVHHAVKNLDEALSMYERLWGLKPILRLSTPQEGVNNAILPLGKNNYIELLEPIDPQGLVARHIAKKDEGLRSCCLTVQDVGSTVKALKALGVELVEREATPEIPFPSAWVSPRSTRGLLIELCPHQALQRFLESGIGVAKYG